ncbi:hypothetical protein M422DRAFT_64007 [Sphaerobolus stellatus SS14]|nr:hypothetical protein M422DRAFT_64007 [Sphaerobolus stellatus SS14]
MASNVDEPYLAGVKKLHRPTDIQDEPQFGGEGPLQATVEVDGAERTAFSIGDQKEWPEGLVTFESDTDQDNPRNWPTHKKVIVVIIYGANACVFQAASPCFHEKFEISKEVFTLTLSLYLLGFVPGPILFGPFSELYGRRLAMLVSMSLFTAFSISTATADDIQTVMISHGICFAGFFSGFMGSAPVACVGGGLSDLYPQEARGTASALSSLITALGNGLGPIIGSLLCQRIGYQGWRWTEAMIFITVVYRNMLLRCNAVRDSILHAGNIYPCYFNQKGEEVTPENRELVFTRRM